MKWLCEPILLTGHSLQTSDLGHSLHLVVATGSIIKGVLETETILKIQQGFTYSNTTKMP